MLVMTCCKLLLQGQYLFGGYILMVGGSDSPMRVMLNYLIFLVIVSMEYFWW